MGEITGWQLSREAKKISCGLGLKDRLLMTYRPMICPFHVLYDHVPQGSRVLDIGCGSGFFLLLMSRLGRISGGVGVDVDEAKIKIANSLKADNSNLEFGMNDAEGSFPKGSFDCVTMIDVLHHVSPGKQRDFIGNLKDLNVKKIIFKDIDPEAKFKSTMNSIHDIVLSHQKPNYCSKEDIADWLGEMGFVVSFISRCDMLWYSHYLIVAEKAK